MRDAGRIDDAGTVFGITDSTGGRGVILISRILILARPAVIRLLQAFIIDDVSTGGWVLCTGIGRIVPRHSWKRHRAAQADRAQCQQREPGARGDGYRSYRVRHLTVSCWPRAALADCFELELDGFDSTKACTEVCRATPEPHLAIPFSVRSYDVVRSKRSPPV